MFVERRIKVTIEGDANAGGGSTVFDGLRTTARIVKAGGQYLGEAQISIYGLTLDHINKLSTKALLYRPTLNSFKVAVEAGDNVNGMSTVFAGQVRQAWGDFTNMPDVVFHITAQGMTGSANVGPAEPTSGTNVKAEPLIKKLAGIGQLGFRNHGVDVTFASVYHWGSPWKQIREIADAGNFDVFSDDLVCKMVGRDQSIGGDLLVSPQTGMRDYPTFTQRGVLVKVEFTRALDYRQSFTVKSDLKSANGTWHIILIDYDLAAELPGGNWFAILEGAQTSSGSQGT